MIGSQVRKDARYLLFICSSDKRHLEKILNTLKGMNVLTMGDTKGFAQEGVIINFYIDKDKVRFEINKDAADKAGLKISSRLLSLARIIYGDER
ncbi:MAG: YfiR family protein [Thermodesulfovibrionales bacterium]